MWRRRNNAFTQVELLMALAVFGLASAVGFEALRQNMGIFRRITAHVEHVSKESVVLALLRRDLRSATLRDEKFLFVGDEKQLDFVRTGTEPGSFWEVGYRPEKDSVTGQIRLWRRVQLSVDDAGRQGGTDILIDDNATEFDLNYFDGSSWVPTWNWSGGIRGLPLAVRYQSKRTEAIFPLMVSVINKGRSL